MLYLPHQLTILSKTLATAVLLLIADISFSAESELQDVDEDTAKVQTIIESITTLVDLRRFDLLDQFYAEEVIADYSSLWGNEPRTLTRSEVGPGWAGFIPGFDTTRHDISNIRVDISGANANASADVIASHWLDSELWVIEGHYTYEFVRIAENWLVESWVFVLESEAGDRGLVDFAEERARTLQSDN